MTINEYRRLRISIATLGMLLACAVCADRAQAQFQGWTCEQTANTPNTPFAVASIDCVPITFAAHVQVSNLHPAVTHVQMRCNAALPQSSLPPSSPSDGLSSTSNRIAVVNRAVTGDVTAIIKAPRTSLADPANRMILVGCQLQLVKGATVTSAESTASAVASATQPVGVLDSNWTVVASDSTILWTDTVTITNANPAP